MVLREYFYVGTKRDKLTAGWKNVQEDSFIISTFQQIQIIDRLTDLLIMRFITRGRTEQ